MISNRFKQQVLEISKTDFVCQKKSVLGRLGKTCQEMINMSQIVLFFHQTCFFFYEKNKVLSRRQPGFVYTFNFTKLMHFQQHRFWDGCTKIVKHDIQLVINQ